MSVRAEDAVGHVFVATTHSFIVIFSNRGRAYWQKVHGIPVVGPGGRGTAIVNLVKMEPDERIAALLAVRDWPDAEGAEYLVMGTRKGIVKKTDLRAFSNPRAGGIIAMGVDEDDEVIAVQRSDGTHEIFLGTRHGMAIRFPESDVRAMGRTAYGVRGITLREGDEVVAMDVIAADGYLLTVTDGGYGKRTPVDEYRVQTRGGVGLINIRFREDGQHVIGIAFVGDEDQLMLMTEQGKVLRTPVRSIRPIGRDTQGVRLIGIEDGDRVVSMVRLAERVDDENGEVEGDTPDNGAPEQDTE